MYLVFVPSMSLTKEEFHIVKALTMKMTFSLVEN